MNRKEYYVVCVSHVDMAYAMQEEAHDEMIDILLERIISEMERNKEIKFALEQAAHYRKLEKRRPDLFRKVKELLAQGRMEFLGGMATTAETNLPDGECLVHNQGMGLVWLKEHLGITPKNGWLVDTFGLNAQVPQIMKQFGMKDLYADRFGGNKRYDLFWDEGLDKTRIRVSGKDLASANHRPDSHAFKFCTSWEDVNQLFADADKLDSEFPKIVVYYLENEKPYSEYYWKLMEERNLKDGVWKHASYAEYSDILDDFEDKLPVISGDLNPEFTGTFALRTPIRTANRKAEKLLLEAEKWAALLRGVNPEELEDCWWDLFFNQFHDVFSGSHEDITYDNVMNKFRNIMETSQQVLTKELQLKEAENTICCCNGLPWNRKEWIMLPGDGRKQVVSMDGSTVPSVEKENKTWFLAEVPAGGIRSYRLQNCDDVKKEVVEKGCEIQNEFFKLRLSEQDGIDSLEDLSGNCFIQKAFDFLTAEEDRGGLQIEGCTGKEIYAMSGKVKLCKIHKNDMEECISMSGTFPNMPWNGGNNSLKWNIIFSLRRGEKALRMKLTLEWKGEVTRIRLKVPGSMPGRDVFYEVPFGVIRREAYKNLPTAKGEWPAHRFVAMENGNMGIGLINNGVAGVEQEGSKLVTTLIRAYGDNGWVRVKPSAASSQHGTQTFEFVIVPYMGNWKDSGILQLAQEVNQPVGIWQGDVNSCQVEKSLFEISEKNLVLSSIKMAWDGSGETVVRLYETEGIKTKGTVRIQGMDKAWLADLRETKGAELQVEEDTVCLELEPYEIKTIRLSRECI